MWEDVHRLCANTTTFYTRDLSIYTFWYLRAVLEPDHQGYWGTMKLYSASVLGISLCIHGCFIDIFPNLLLSFPFRKTILLLKSFPTLVLVFELYKKKWWKRVRGCCLHLRFLRSEEVNISSISQMLFYHGQ